MGRSETLEDISVMVASAKVTITIVSIVSLGPLAAWLKVYWYPTWQRLWDLAHIHMGFPQFSIAEKDALTSTIFFLPFFFVALFHIKNDIPKKTTKNNRSTLAQSVDQALDNNLGFLPSRYRLASAFAVFVVIVMAYQPLRDLLFVVTGGGEKIIQQIAVEQGIVGDVEAMQKLRNEISERGFGIVSLAAFIVTLMVAAILVRSQRKDGKESTLQRIVSLPMRLFYIVMGFFSNSYRYGVPQPEIMYLVFISLGGIFTAIAISAGFLGVVRTIAPMIIVAAVLISVITTPRRMVKMMGAIVVLCLFAFGFETVASIWKLLDVQV